MDEALIKPQRVRRVVKIQPPPAGAEADVTAQGTLVEVAVPRALRPRDFRTDFVYRPERTTEDVALCELPSLLESVLGGTDGLLVVGGASGAGQADLLDGFGGLAARGVGQLAVELQARQARHRSSGSGGYSYYLRLQAFHVLGDRVEDLLTDRPEPTRLVDTPGGVVVEGLRAVGITAAEEGMRSLEAARRRQDPAQRAKAATVVIAEVTQADYFAGWGLFGRFLVVETPALDCLAEDRGLVQLRDGFETFRGVYHLRTLVQSWQPRKPGDVNGSVLTWLLRDMLCGGSVSATVLMCLRQQQPAISLALLEFLELLSKVETNPVCCDHRVAGLTRAMRAELLLARQRALGRPGGERDADDDEEARRIILELEKRLRVAERRNEDAARHEEMKQGRAVDFHDRYLGAIHGQELMHDRLVLSEEEHLRACEGLVEAQLTSSEVREELSELRYKDNVLLMVLEQEVADLQTAARPSSDATEALEVAWREEAQQCAALEARFAEAAEAASSLSTVAVGGEAADLVQARQRADDLRASLDAATEARIQLEIAREVDRGTLENRLEALKVELGREALENSRRFDEEARAVQVREEESQSELRMLRRVVSELREQVALEAVAEREARDDAEAARAEAVRTRGDFQKSLARLAASTPTQEVAEEDHGPPRSPAAVGVADVRSQLEQLVRESVDREQVLQQEKRTLQAQVRELRQSLSWAARVALDWAPLHGAEDDKAKLADVVADAHRRASAQGVVETARDEELHSQHEALRSEADRLRQELEVMRAEHARELRRKEVEIKRLEAELLGLRPAEGGSLPLVAQIQQQLLKEVEALRNGTSQGPDLELREQNRALKTRLEQLEKHLPGDQRLQSQRLAFLERATRDLEGERSELLVRATVAEEQLVQLQRHLKDLTEGYQMQILQLKLKARGA